MASSSNNFRRWDNMESQRPRPMNSRRAQEEQYYRQRDEEKRRAEEQQRRAEEERVRKATDVKSEAAYPSLGGPRPKAPVLGKNSFAALSNDASVAARPAGNMFAKLATEWKKDDEAAQQKEKLRRIQTEREKYSSEGIFVYRPRRQVEGGYGGYEEPEEEEQPRSKTDAEGWQEISRKTFKAKKEMSADEMDELYGNGDESDEDDEYDDGRNEHLFEVSHRHDHY